MSFLYPRTIAITRPNNPTGVGAVGYGGELPANETNVISGLPASIQRKGQAKKNEAGLPGDGKTGTWQIFFKAANGTVRNRDIITDDLGLRYQVLAAYWNSLGYNCQCELLET